MADFGISEAAAAASVISSGASLASMGMKAGGDVASGYAKAAEAKVKAQNFLTEGQTRAANYLTQGATAAANYRYRGDQELAQFGLESQADLMRASEADTAAKFGDLRAAMTDAGARQELSTALGNIATIRAAGGADFTSPTTAALEGRATGISDLNREAAVASIKGQSAEERAAADYLRQASAFALTQGQSAKTMGEFNATQALTYADFNAKTAMEYATRNAAAATTLGDTATGMGFMNAGSDVLGGLGKAFANFRPSAPGSGADFSFGGSGAP